MAWTLVLPLAAVAATARHAPAGAYLAAALAYAIGGVICHQQTARSFHLLGAQLPVCARCTGIYLGAAVAGVGLAAWPQSCRRVDTAACRMVRAVTPRTAAPDRALFAGACVPIALTLVFEWTTGITPSNVIRAASGLPLGAAVTWLVLSRT